ncbi:MAG: hypothetical protein IJU66_08675 [Oscillospiraceae bacterium]|nr:hypothetical protein [Oscillospiraceae bacterium]
MKKTAKTALFLCAALLCALFAAPAQADNSKSDNYAVYSDIIVKIDGYPIRAYFINDRAALAVNDLKGYGFDVTTDGDSICIEHTRELVMEEGWDEFLNNVTEEMVGTRWVDVYPSERAVYVAGKRVESLSADGETLIWLESLEPFGLIYMDSLNRVYELTFSESVHRTVHPLISVARSGGKTMVQTTEYVGQTVVVTMNTRGVKVCAPAWLLDSEGAQSNKFVAIMNSLRGLGFPNASAGDAASNTREQRDAAAQYVVVTLNGEKVYGDLWWSEGKNGQINLNFSFTEPLHLNTSDELVFALDGTSAALH